MDPLTMMTLMGAVNAIKSSKDASAKNSMESANIAASPWTNAKGNVNFSKAPEILTQAAGTYYAMDREQERDKLAKMGKTSEARAMGGTDMNPWSFGQLMMPNNSFGAQG